MVRKHISRDFIRYKQSVERPDDEYIKVQIFSYDHPYTMKYTPSRNNINSVNGVFTNWRSLSCVISENKHDPVNISVNYHVSEPSEYRIDLLYEKCDYLFNDINYDTSESIVGEYSINGEIEDYIRFDGANNVTKRKTLYHRLSEGDYNFNFSIPHNCMFIGVIIRKIKEYWGDNIDSAGSNLMFDKASFSNGGMLSTKELSFEIAYDDDFEYPESPSGVYMQFHDEVNLEVKDNDGIVQRIFGGYISSILKNDSGTRLEISCADRLLDSETSYILEQLSIKGGELSFDSNDYLTGMKKNFNNYPEILKYLCEICEITLDSNITPDYLVEGEKFQDGIILRYDNKNLQNEISVINGQLEKYDGFVLLRNNSSGKKKQEWTIYDARKHAQRPPALYGLEDGIIQNNGYLHITYGLGQTKVSKQQKLTTTVDTASVTAGSQKFGKCGVSQDKKYVMAIGQPSCGKSHWGSYKYNQIYKTVFVNKCPHCGGTLVWDSGRSDTNCIHCGPYKKSKREWGPIPETELTCTHCCADFCAVTGWDKDGKYSKKLKKVSTTRKSNKAEQNKLHNGNMVAVPKANTTVSPDEVFDAIWNIGKQYTYDSQGASTYADMKHTGSGDSWAFSELIFNELKKYKVDVKIVRYASNKEEEKHSVLYKNAKNKWEDYPYSKHNWNKNLRPSSKSINAPYVEKDLTGGNIKQVSVSTSTSKSQTTKVTTTNGYDKDNAFQAYIELIYSNTPSFKAPQKSIFIDFTQQSGSDDAMTGLNPFWVNNTTKEAVSENIIEFIQSFEGENTPIYLQKIKFITPAIVTTNKNDKVDWYTDDDTTKDNSSCKMNLYQIVFNNNKQGNSDDLETCGQTVNSVFENICNDAGYNVYMTYGEHRCDDKINFKVSDQTEPVLTAHEGDSTAGDNTYILEWSNIEYKPVESMKNHSVVVFKKKDKKYYFVDTRDPDSVLEYGEQTTILTENDIMGSKQAYFTATHNESYNPEQTYSFTIKLPNYPYLLLGDIITVLSNAKKLNSIKEVKSINLDYDIKNMPRITTDIGCDELAIDLLISQQLREMRQSTKKDTTTFSSSARPILDKEIYQWDN